MFSIPLCLLEAYKWIKFKKERRMEVEWIASSFSPPEERIQKQHLSSFFVTSIYIHLSKAEWVL